MQDSEINDRGSDINEPDLNTQKDKKLERLQHWDFNRSVKD